MEKTYKITKLVICILLLCLSLGTAIYFAVIPFVNVNTGYNLSNPNKIELFIDGQYKKSVSAEDGAYNEILNLFNDSFITTKSDVVFGNEVIEDTKLQTSKPLDKSKGVYLEFSYTTTPPQKLTHGYTNTEYTSITIEILDKEKMSLTNAYFVDKGTITNGKTYKYTTYSKMHKLYEYLQDLA